MIKQRRRSLLNRWENNIQNISRIKYNITFIIQNKVKQIWINNTEFRERKRDGWGARGGEKEREERGEIYI